MTTWMSRADDDDEMFLDLDPTVVTLVGEIAILGTQLEDEIYKICDALELGDCRGAGATAAADRFKKKAKQENGLPPWARVDEGDVVACCSAVKSALNDRNDVIHAAYLNRFNGSAWEPSTTRTSGNAPLRLIDAARYQRIFDTLRFASREAVEIWLGLLPLLAPQIYDQKFGASAGDVLIVAEGNEWPLQPGDNELAELRAAFNATFLAAGEINSSHL
ncbi:hypothetical protein ACGIF2_09350 [Cellulomonas sp. P22]|uniref:hypothetical protein n=1 Tax=Cellulomonas sp. P22 TaxID=3373189 RepID=UPI0037A305BD